MSKAIIFDTETTDVEDPDIVSAAYLEISPKLESVYTFHQFYKPDREITFGAMAVHHILHSDLVDCRPSGSFALPADTDYIIGHNIDFDWRAIGSPDVKRICTLALSRAFWPRLDSHTQSAMIYALTGDTFRDTLKSAHDALVDVRMNLELLKFIVGETGLNPGFDEVDFEDLWQRSEVARVPKVMPFGKHKGVPIKSVPHSYKKWLLSQSDIDPYLVQALRAP